MLTLLVNGFSFVELPNELVLVNDAVLVDVEEVHESVDLLLFKVWGETLHELSYFAYTHPSVIIDIAKIEHLLVRDVLLS